MRKLVYLIILGLAAYFLYTKYAANPGNPEPGAQADTSGTLANPSATPAVAVPATASPSAPSSITSSTPSAPVTSAPPVNTPPVAPAPAGSTYLTVAEATQAALKHYPSLAVAGSAFNKEYVSRYNRYKQEHPDYFKDVSWPVRLADEVAQAIPAQAAVQPPALPAATAPVFVTHHFTTSLASAKSAPPRTLKSGDAFSLAQIEEAKARAQKERKPIGFIMCWGQFFEKNVNTRTKGSESAFVHFYEAFHSGLVLVFVRHETELQSVPDAVKKGFFGPDEGGFAPNMAVVDATASEYIVEIPMGGGDSDGKKRDEIFATDAEKIDQWLATHPSAIGTAK